LKTQGLETLKLKDKAIKSWQKSQRLQNFTKKDDDDDDDETS
jgi:hypothetical protein